MNNTKYFDEVVERCDEKIANVKRGIEKFVAELTDNPAYAFRWADAKMGLAAEGYVAEVVKEMTLTCKAEGESPEILRERVTRAAVQAGKYMKRSTSQSSNYMDNAKAAAWCDCMDDFGGLLGGRY